MEVTADAIFDVPGFAMDEGLVAAIGRIRAAVLDPSVQLAALPASNSRIAVVTLVQLLAFVGASDAQAVVVAQEIAAQIHGSEAEIHHEIGGVVVTVEAAEPFDELTDVTDLVFDGHAVATIHTCRGSLVRIEGDWDRLETHAARR